MPASFSASLNQPLHPFHSQHHMLWEPTRWVKDVPHPGEGRARPVSPQPDAIINFQARPACLLALSLTPQSSTLMPSQSMDLAHSSKAFITAYCCKGEENMKKSSYEVSMRAS